MIRIVHRHRIPPDMRPTALGTVACVVHQNTALFNNYDLKISVWLQQTQRTVLDYRATRYRNSRHCFPRKPLLCVRESREMYKPRRAAAMNGYCENGLQTPQGRLTQPVHGKVGCVWSRLDNDVESGQWKILSCKSSNLVHRCFW